MRYKRKKIKRKEKSIKFRNVFELIRFKTAHKFQQNPIDSIKGLVIDDFSQL